MGHVEFDREPPTNLTTLVIAFGGWIDAGHAATGALRHLVQDLSAARLAWIDPEEFFVFTLERPEVRLRSDETREASSSRGSRRIAGTACSCSAARSHISGGAPMRRRSSMWLSAVG